MKSARKPRPAPRSRVVQQRSASGRPHPQRPAAATPPTAAAPPADPAQPTAAHPATAPRPAVVALPADCLLQAVPPLHARLRGYLDSPEVVLEVSALQRIDTACMQLIAAFAGDRARTGRPFHWRGTSAAWDEAVRLLGLDRLLPRAA